MKDHRQSFETGLVACPVCGTHFELRSNKRFCSAKCRKKQHQNEVTSSLRGSTPSRVQRNNERLFQLNDKLSWEFYTQTTRFERLGYMQTKLDEAKSEGGLLKELLTNRYFLRPDPERHTSAFFKGSRNYLTFPQACNQYLLASPLQCGVVEYMADKYNEATGEVFPDGSIDHGPYWDFEETQRPTDKSGKYINDWYSEGWQHPKLNEYEGVSVPEDWNHYRTVTNALIDHVLGAAIQDYEPVASIPWEIVKTLPSEEVDVPIIPPIGQVEKIDDDTQATEYVAEAHKEETSEVRKYSAEYYMAIFHEDTT